jgi:phosphoglycerate dehydrogenase-like enzyme
LKLVIPHDFSFAKYLPGDKMLPYFATARKLRDEIVKRDQTIDVIAAEHARQLRTELVQADGCICYSMTQDLLDEAPRLRWIQAGSAGIDHFFKSSDIKLTDLNAKGIRLTKAAGVTRHVIGEHVFAMILAMSRNVSRAVRQKEARIWQIFMGEELHGATLGVIGLGGIGNRVA